MSQYLEPFCCGGFCSQKHRLLEKRILSPEVKTYVITISDVNSIQIAYASSIWLLFWGLSRLRQLQREKREQRYAPIFLNTCMLKFSLFYFIFYCNLDLLCSVVAAQKAKSGPGCKAPLPRPADVSGLRFCLLRNVS